MHSLKHCIFYLVTLYFIFWTNLSLANITDYKFYAGQVHDAQRNPAFPVANYPFQLSYLHDPYRANHTPYKLKDREYIQLYYIGGRCKNGRVGIKRYNSRGILIETVQSSGHIYGLSPKGFLHDNDNNIGTFISTYRLKNDYSLTYVPRTGPVPITCTKLKRIKWRERSDVAGAN